MVDAEFIPYPRRHPGFPESNSDADGSRDDGLFLDYLFVKCIIPDKK
jgi:hypothetical protein